MPWLSDLYDPVCQTLPMYSIGYRISAGAAKLTQAYWENGNRGAFVKADSLNNFQVIELCDGPDRGRLVEDRSWAGRVNAAILEGRKYTKGGKGLRIVRRPPPKATTLRRRIEDYEVLRGPLGGSTGVVYLLECGHLVERHAPAAFSSHEFAICEFCRNEQLTGRERL